MYHRTIFFSVALALAACSAPPEPLGPVDVLVTGDWLEANYDHPDLRVIHLYDQAEPAATIPGARTIPQVTFGQAPPAIADALTRAGITNEHHIVFVGEGSPLGASYAFAVLEQIGHRGKTSVLDGGFQMWASANRKTGSPDDDVHEGGVPFAIQLADNVMVSTDWVAGKLGDSTITLLDVRSDAEYQGTNEGNAVKGRIPGSINMDYTLLYYSNDQPQVRPEETVRSLFAEAGADEGTAVIYCRSGRR
ncbi:MAG: rhodanese-like domain-containing protein, partial [Gemmatimonadota bacterium]|nr:rhodanese-like domain-containing protein [Gemmatimonadota bacterium]